MRTPKLTNINLCQSAPSADKNLRAPCALCVKLSLLFLIEFLCELRVLGGKKKVNLQNKKMSNEPNLHPINHSLIYPFTHLLINSIMSNEPNFKNPKISLTPFITMAYINFNRFQHQKNEPNSNPINNSLKYSFTHLLINSFMQNEPNLRQFTHLNKKQPTTNYEKIQTNPISKTPKLA